MPAPSTEILFDYKTKFGVATAAILAAAGYTQAQLERDAERLSASIRYEISFDLGEALNEEVRPDGSHVYDYYAAALRIRLVTGRRPKQLTSADPALHNLFVARVLSRLEERLAPFDPFLEWYQVKKIRPLGTASGFDPLYIEDYTDISHALEFGIKSTAWPVSA